MLVLACSGGAGRLTPGSAASSAPTRGSRRWRCSAPWPRCSCWHCRSRRPSTTASAGCAPVVLAIATSRFAVLHLVSSGSLRGRRPGLRRQLVRFMPSLLGSTALLLVASQLDGQAQTLAVAGRAGRRLRRDHARRGVGMEVELGRALRRTPRADPHRRPRRIDRRDRRGGGRRCRSRGRSSSRRSSGSTVAAAIWWAYFDVVSLVAERVLRRAEGEERTRMARDAYTYLHFPMIAGVVLFALGMKKVLVVHRRPGHHDLAEALRRSRSRAVRRCGGLPDRAVSACATATSAAGTVQRLVSAALLRCCRSPPPSRRWPRSRSGWPPARPDRLRGLAPRRRPRRRPARALAGTDWSSRPTTPSARGRCTRAGELDGGRRAGAEAQTPSLAASCRARCSEAGALFRALDGEAVGRADSTWCLVALSDMITAGCGSKTSRTKAPQSHRSRVQLQSVLSRAGRQRARPQSLRGERSSTGTAAPPGMARRVHAVADAAPLARARPTHETRRRPAGRGAWRWPAGWGIGTAEAAQIRRGGGPPRSASAARIAFAGFRWGRPARPGRPHRGATALLAQAWPMRGQVPTTVWASSLVQPSVLPVAPCCALSVAAVGQLARTPGPSTMVSVSVPGCSM